MKIRYALSAMALTLLAGLASAGHVLSVPVEVDLVNMLAEGDQTTARYSDNDVELIGCGIRALSDGVNPPFTFGFCQATDSAEETIFCSTFDAELIDAIKAVSSHAFITFSWNEIDECTRVGKSSQSFYLPSKKDKK